MSRRAEVQLDLKTAGYIAEARQVETATKLVDEEMKSLDRSVEAVERDMGELAAATAAAKAQVSGLGDKARAAAGDLKLLDERIKAQRAAVAELGQEWLKTGDASILDKWDDARSGLSRLEKARKDIQGLADDLHDLKKIQVVGVFGKMLGEFDPAKGLSSAGDLFNTLPLKSALMPVLIAGAVAAAPAIGAIVGGAVVGAVGLGGIAGGIASAATQPGVQQAAQDFGDTISSEFFGSGASNAFAGPVIDSLQILGQGFRDLDLGDALSKAAPALTTLAHGVVDFAENVMPGFNAVLDQSGPIAQVVATGLGGVGDSLSQFLTEVSDSKGSMEGLELSFRAIGSAIRFTGDAVTFLGDTFDNLATFDAEVTGVFEDVTRFMPGLHEAVARGNDYFEDISGTGAAATSILREIDRDGSKAALTAGDYAAAAAAAAADTDRFREAMRKLDDELLQNIDRNSSALDAQLRLAEGMRTLKHDLTKGKNNWKIGTEKGDSNISEVKERLDEAEAKLKADLAKAGGDGAKAADAQAAYEKTVKDILAIASVAGATKGVLDMLAGTYQIDVVASFRAIGAEASAWANFRNAERGAGKKGHYAGGYDDGSMPYLAGELGPELIFPGGKPSYVMNHGDTAAYLGQQARSWSGTGGGHAPAQAATPYGGPTAAQLGRAVRAAMSGMNVVMDGRPVGRVQGRESDMLMRGV